MAAQPTFLFVPGAWHTPDCFDIVRGQLKTLGYPTEAVSYPSVGAQPPTKGVADDVVVARAKLEELADQSKEIVLVVHSYGGVVGQNSLKGLGYKERAAEGKKGGVVMYVYLSAFVTPLGKSLEDMLGGKFLPWMNRKGDYVFPDTPEDIFYHDMTPAAQGLAMSKLRHQSAAVFSGKAEYEPWKNNIDCMFFFCDEDHAIPLPIQVQMAELLGPDAVTFHCPTSHSAFLSQPEKTVEGLVLAATEGQKRNSLKN